MKTKKNPSSDVEKRKSSLLFIGTLMALSTVLVAFEWTTFEKEIHINSGDWTVDLIEEEIIPVSRMKAPPPPPPPAPTTVIKIVEEPEPRAVPVEILEPAEFPEPTVEPIADPVEHIYEPVIRDYASIMPEFIGGDEEMYRYLGATINFPEMALESQISGVVYTSFVVDTDGSITEVKILKGIGGGCDEEALRVVRNMPLWKPGVQNGTPVKVRYMLPIRFSARN